jgi:acetyl esterase/lipase
VVVNELDPLRDEGRAYFRKLVQAGVKAVGRVNLGIMHGGDTIMRQGIPEVYKMTINDIKRFVDSL